MKIEDSVRAVSAAIAQGRGQALSDDEVTDIRLWHQGRALLTIANSEGFQLIMDMLESYAAREIDDLMATAPENDKKVKSLHATAYALSKRFEAFKRDVERALTSAKAMPDVMRESAKQILSNTDPQNGQI